MRRIGFLLGLLAGPLAAPAPCAAAADALDALGQLGGEVYRGDTGPVNITFPFTVRDEDKLDAIVAAAATMKEEFAIKIATSKLTDRQFGRLAACPRVASIHIQSVDAGDLTYECLAAAGASKSLKGLSLTGLNAVAADKKDKAFEELAKAKQLTSLSLVACELTGHHVARIAELENLESLILGATPLTDAHVGKLAKLGKLTTLDLFRSNNVSDDCIPHLLALKKLRSVRLEMTGVSAAGIKKLKAGLPDCAFLE